MGFGSRFMVWLLLLGLPLGGVSASGIWLWWMGILTTSPNFIFEACHCPLFTTTFIFCTKGSRITLFCITCFTRTIIIYLTVTIVINAITFFSFGKDLTDTLITPLILVITKLFSYMTRIISFSRC